MVRFYIYIFYRLDTCNYPFNDWKAIYHCFQIRGLKLHAESISLNLIVKKLSRPLVHVVLLHKSNMRYYYHFYSSRKNYRHRKTEKTFSVSYTHLHGQQQVGTRGEINFQKTHDGSRGYLLLGVFQ